jgi:hypothetical protein
MLVMRAGHCMLSSCFARRKMRNGLLLMLLAVGGVRSPAQKSAGSETTSPLARAINRTLAEGHDAILPPHVSNLLGISPNEHEVAVKQFVEMGEPIRGFEVSTAEHNNVVIFVENRAQKQSTFYLMSKRGTLRKVLAVIEGTGYARQPTKQDRVAFATEKQRWVDQLAPKHS